jgi:putative membrane protein
MLPFERFSLSREHDMKFKWLVIAVGVVGALTACGKKDEVAERFYTHAIQADTAAMKLGELAAQMGDSEEVRNFGETVRNDHRIQVKSMTKGAADTGFTIQETVSPEVTAEIAKLSKMSGGEFDDEFVNFMLVSNQHDVAEFEAATKSPNAIVAQSAKKALPTLQKHLKMAQTLKGPAAAAPATGSSAS